MAKCAAISYKQLGDTLLLQPALAKLAEHSGSDVDLITKPVFEPLLELMPGVSKAGQAGKYDELWVFEHGSKAVWRAFMTQASRKYLRLIRPQYKRWYHPLVFSDIVAKPLSYEYRALCHYRAVHGSNDGFMPPRLLSPPADAHPASCPRGAVLISPTSAWRSKTWSVKAWARVIDDIHQSYDLSPVLIGQGDAWMANHVRQIAAAASTKLVNLFNQTSLRELLATIASARAVVAIDGASAHLAAALSIPSLTLFGPTRAEEWHWKSARTTILRTADFNEGKRLPLHDLPVASALEALDRLINLGEC